MLRAIRPPGVRTMEPPTLSLLNLVRRYVEFRPVRDWLAPGQPWHAQDDHGCHRVALDVAHSAYADTSASQKPVPASFTNEKDPAATSARLTRRMDS